MSLSISPESFFLISVASNGNTETAVGWISCVWWEFAIYMASGSFYRMSPCNFSSTAVQGSWTQDIDSQSFKSNRSNRPWCKLQGFLWCCNLTSKYRPSGLISIHYCTKLVPTVEPFCLLFPLPELLCSWIFSWIALYVIQFSAQIHCCVATVLT